MAYSEESRILEVTYKSGQVWQLFGVPPYIYGELRETTLDSFVKFIAQRYKAAPVKTGLKAIKVPDFEKYSKCNSNMKVRHRINNQFDIMIRILWECSSCSRTEWKHYDSGRKRREQDVERPLCHCLFAEAFSRAGLKRTVTSADEL